MPNVFMYKINDTLYYAIFHEIFEVNIYLQKADIYGFLPIYPNPVLFNWEAKKDNMNSIYCFLHASQGKKS